MLTWQTWHEIENKPPKYTQNVHYDIYKDVEHNVSNIRKFENLVLLSMGFFFSQILIDFAENCDFLRI